MSGRSEGNASNARPVLNRINNEMSRRNRLLRMKHLVYLVENGRYGQNKREPVSSYQNGHSFFKVNRPPKNVEERLQALEPLPRSRSRSRSRSPRRQTRKRGRARSPLPDVPPIPNKKNAQTRRRGWPWGR